MTGASRSALNNLKADIDIGLADVAAGRVEDFDVARIAGRGRNLPATKRRLGLDAARSWIVIVEANRFTWPGPDLRPLRTADAVSVVYGELPGNLFRQVRDKWLALAAQRRIVKRTE